MSKAIYVNIGNLESVVKDSTVPVLLDFYADYCGPCRMLKPIIESMAESFGDNVKVAIVDVVENAELIERFGLTAVPTLIVLKQGKETFRSNGLENLHKLKEALGV